MAFLIIIVIIIFIIIISLAVNQTSTPSLNLKKSTNNVTNYDDIISNYEFSANIWDPHTSLEALNHHGEILKNIKESKLPSYGDDLRSYGCWLPLVNDKNIQLEKPSKTEDRELEFLKKFRTTYESNLSHDKKYEVISALSVEYKDLDLHKSITDWYLWELCEISGISYNISEILYAKGIKTKQDVSTSADKTLLLIPGLGKARLKQIRDYFSKNSGCEKISHIKSKTQNERDNYYHHNSKIKEKKIDLSSATQIHLPNLKYEKTPDPNNLVKQDWEKYDIITKKALLLYKTDNYEKSKHEWLKIYDWHHKDENYFTNLLRTYRKLIELLIKKNLYEDALLTFNELFDKCSNFSNTDIHKYNFIVSKLNKINPDNNLKKKEPITIEELDYKIDSKTVTFLQELKKPRGIKYEHTGESSMLDLLSKSDYLPLSLPHIQFDDKIIVYKEISTIPSIPNNTYRFRESSSLNAFMSSSKKLTIYLYKWNNELLYSFDASKYSENHTYLRRIELSTDLSCFLFTVVDKAYLLDSKMNLINSWQVPYKDGFEKVNINNSNNTNTIIKEYLNLLNLPENSKPSKGDIKLEFRKLIIKWHPDKNPNNPLAEEKTRQLIQAYEYLSGEDAQSAFDGINKDDYYWVDVNRLKTFEIEGVKVNLSLVIGSGEDWIYGAGISNDGSLSRMFAKIIKTNKKGPFIY